MPPEAIPQEFCSAFEAPRTLTELRALRDAVGEHRLGGMLLLLCHREQIRPLVRLLRAMHPNVIPADGRAMASLVAFLTVVLTEGRYQANFEDTAP